MSSVKEFQHLQIPLKDLKSATNDFADANCIGGGGFGKVHKGELLLSAGITTVAIKRLDRKLGQGTPEFWKEIMIKTNRALIKYELLHYEYLSNKSLDLYLSSTSLSWHQRLNICIGAAIGLKFLHEPVKGSQQRVLHRDIKSANILLDQNWQPKISDFGLSKFGPANQPFSFIFSGAVGTVGYCDPLYAHNGFLTKESDVYSFGVVLFEVLCGRSTYVQNDNDISRFLTVLARKRYEEKKLDTIVHVGLKDIISPRSLEIFSSIAYQCLHIDHLQRPSMHKIVGELKNANLYQLIYENSPLQVPLKEIEEATNNFKMCIGHSVYSRTYKGDLSIFGKPTTVFIDRYREHSGHKLWLFLIRVHKLYCQPHPNILSILGYCDEDREKIIVFEYAERGRLDQYIRRSNSTSTTLMWLQRLEICVSAASAINHCHRTIFSYGSFDSSKILLDNKWVAKVTDFWIYNPGSTGHVANPAYYAPEYISTGFTATKETNVYSFGMVLFEVLCGRLCGEVVDGYMLSAKLAKDLYEKKKLDEIVDPSLKVQMISSYSIDKFSTIAYRCLSDDPKERPSMDAVIKELHELRRIKVIFKNSLPEVPLKEIEVATNNFKKSIGESVYSHIYKGDLSTFGTSITVFIERYRDQLSGIILKFFLIKVQNLSHHLHPNVISCLGYCYEEREKIIVYEYPERGRLDQYIRRSNTTSTILTWLQRLEICAGAASAVDHTHKRFEICYGNFESSKILLNDKWVAKVTDFWIFTPSSPDALANQAYFAPEFIIKRIPTNETNVYSFGMVLFEVLCGRLCSEDVDGYMLSAKLVKDLYEKKKLYEIVDPCLREQISYSMDKYSAIAYRCLLDDPKERPSMDAVIKELGELIQIEMEFEKRSKKLLERAKAAEEWKKVATEREKKMQAEMELIEEELAQEQTLRKEMEERMKEFN